MAELKHPKWCAVELCTAEATPTRAPYGEHQSPPVQLDTAGAFFPLPQPVTVRLFRAHAPWLTQTFLMLRVGDTEISFPLNAGQALVDQVVPLLWAEDEHALVEGVPL